MNTFAPVGLDPGSSTIASLVSWASAPVSRRVGFRAWGTRLFVVGNPAAPDPGATFAVARFKAKVASSDTLVVEADASWTVDAAIRAPLVRVEHPTVFANSGTQSDALLSAKITIAASRSVLFRIGQPTMAVGAVAFVPAAGKILHEPTVPASPRVLITADGEMVLRHAGLAIARVYTQQLQSVAVAPSPATPPAVQTIGRGLAGSAWEGRLVYRTAGGSLVSLAP